MSESPHEFRTVAVPESSRRYARRPRSPFWTAVMWLLALAAMLAFVVAVTPR